jgi:hypothetical protein
MNVEHDAEPTIANTATYNKRSIPHKEQTIHHFLRNIPEVTHQRGRVMKCFEIWMTIHICVSIYFVTGKPTKGREAPGTEVKHSFQNNWSKIQTPSHPA